jgi:hypothetical protein
VSLCRLERKGTFLFLWKLKSFNLILFESTPLEGTRERGWGQVDRSGTKILGIIK